MPNATPQDTNSGPCKIEASILEYDQLQALDLPERKFILPWLPEGGLSMAYAPRGLGKTFFGLSLAASVTSGYKDFMDRWEVQNPTGVLYIDGEMAIGEIKERLAGLVDTEYKRHPLNILSHEFFYEKFECDLSITSPRIQEDILETIERQKNVGLLIIDNLSSLARIREDKSDDWRAHVQPFLIACRRRGVAVLIIHHTGKNGEQRGTGAREDLLDASIKLSKLDNDDNTGAYFRVDFTKARSCYGPDIEPFTARLTKIPSGRLVWTTQSIADSTKGRLINLIKDAGSNGITVTKAANELNCTKGYVSRLKKQLENDHIIHITSGKRPMIIADNLKDTN